MASRSRAAGPSGSRYLRTVLSAAEPQSLIPFWRTSFTWSSRTHPGCCARTAGDASRDDPRYEAHPETELSTNSPKRAERNRLFNLKPIELVGFRSDQHDEQNHSQNGRGSGGTDHHGVTTAVVLGFAGL